MSIRHNGVVIAGGGGSVYHPDLFDWKWADHQLNDVQWLRADTFSWQNGSVYEAAYDHLEADITGKTLTSETVAGVTVQFYLADDGHKICPDTEESNVASIYTATGVAWYYIIDTTNERFKLPRTKFGVTGLRDTVGNYVAPGLPNIIGDLGNPNTLTNYGERGTVSGAFREKWNNVGYGNTTLGSETRWSVEFDASLSNSIYGNSTTVQAPATQMYLYFFVGEFTQTALENTAGLNASLFNGKADVDLSNAVSNASITAKQTIIGWGIPDLTTGVSVSTSGFTSTKKQWLCIRAGVINTYFDCLVNGIVVSTRYVGNVGLNTSDWYPLDVGDVVTFTGTSSYFDCATYDMKGL